MDLTIEIHTDNNYEMADLIAAFHYALQCGEEKMNDKELIEYRDIIKDIRRNEPLILSV